MNQESKREAQLSNVAISSDQLVLLLTIISPFCPPNVLQVSLRRMLTRKWLTNDDDFKRLRSRTEQLSHDCAAMRPDHGQVRRTGGAGGRSQAEWEEGRDFSGFHQASVFLHPELLAENLMRSLILSQIESESKQMIGASTVLLQRLDTSCLSSLT